MIFFILLPHWRAFSTFYFSLSLSFDSDIFGRISFSTAERIFRFDIARLTSAQENSVWHKTYISCVKLKRKGTAACFLFRSMFLTEAKRWHAQSRFGMTKINCWTGANHLMEIISIISNYQQDKLVPDAIYTHSFISRSACHAHCSFVHVPWILLSKNFSKGIFFQLIYYLLSDIFIPSMAEHHFDSKKNLSKITLFINRCNDHIEIERINWMKIERKV